MLVLSYSVLGYELRGIAHLVTGAGTGEEDTGGLACKGRGGAGLAQVSEGGDLGLDEALLAEAGLGVGDGQGDDGKLAGRHCGGVIPSPKKTR